MPDTNGAALSIDPEALAKAKAGLEKKLQDELAASEQHTVLHATQGVCHNCRFSFFQGLNNPNRLYECRKNPPVVTVFMTQKGQINVTTHPQVKATQWCGAHEKRE